MSSAAANQSSTFRSLIHGVPGCRCRLRHQRRLTAVRAQLQAEPVQLRSLYPPLRPFATGHLAVGGGHTLYYEVSGNRRGVPALFLHGGPGAGCYPNHSRFFDPQHYQIVLVDQRGCGRSTPLGCLQDNNTGALVSDMESLRQHLGFGAWGLVLGGSWGVALALAYAQAHPDAVGALLLRGVCLMRPNELHWMYGGGAAALKPAAWQAFLEELEPRERCHPLLGYYRRFLSPDAAVRGSAAKAWMAWEMAVGFSARSSSLVWDGSQWGELQQAAGASGQPAAAATAAAAASAAQAADRRQHPVLSRGATLPAELLAGDASAHPHQQQQQRAPSDVAGAMSAEPRVGLGADLRDSDVAATIWQGLRFPGLSGSAGGSVAQALLEAHYSLHGAFLLDAPLLDHVDRIRAAGIPCIAVQGQLDFVCPPSTAYALHRAWPEMELRLVANAGHSMYDPAITHELVAATDALRLTSAARAAELQPGPRLAAQRQAPR